MKELGPLGGAHAGCAPLNPPMVRLYKNEIFNKKWVIRSLRFTWRDSFCFQNGCHFCFRNQGFFYCFQVVLWPTNICCNLILKFFFFFFFHWLDQLGLEPPTFRTSLLHATKSPIGLAHLEIPSRHEALLSLLFYCYWLVTCPVTVLFI